MEVKPKNIPKELKSRNQWVVWKNVERNGQETKLPFQPDGSPAKSNDSSTWCSFYEAMKAFEAGGYDGPGFMFSIDDEFAGVDLDGCRNRETGKVAGWAKEIILRYNSYAEVSPSGTGVKIFVRAKSPFETGKKKNVDAEKTSEKTPGIETYDRLRYFAITGQKLAGIPGVVEQRQDIHEEYCEEWFPQPKTSTANYQQPGASNLDERAGKYLAKVPPSISGQSGHNAAYHAACILIHGFGMSIERARPLFEEWNASCTPPWSPSEIEHKLHSAEKDTGERNYLRDVPMRQWNQVTVPKYEAPKPLPKLTTLQQSVDAYLQRVKSGKRQFVSLGIPDVDYTLAGGIEFGEMVIVGARPSHGKSALGLQSVASATAAGLTSLIISEEMSALALEKRTILFSSDIPEENWKYQYEQVETQLAAHFLNKAPCYISELVGTAERAATVIRKAVVDDCVRFVIIDYAQLLMGRGGTRYEQVSSTSIVLRQLATELEIVLVVLCQLSRGVETRGAFLPVMSDLKDSGQLEQDADVVLFLCWPHRLDSKRDPHEYQVFVAKNRNRAINQSVVECKFFPSRQMITDDRATLTDVTNLDVSKLFGDDSF